MFNVLHDLTSLGLPHEGIVLNTEGGEKQETLTGKGPRARLLGLDIQHSEPISRVNVLSGVELGYHGLCVIIRSVEVEDEDVLLSETVYLWRETSLDICITKC